MRIYLDVSCLDRAFDDQSQQRIRIETEAISLVFDRFERGEWTHVSSEMARIEIEAMPDLGRRRLVNILLPDPSDIMPLTARVFERAETLTGLGIAAADAVHLACAEAQHSDILLSCDDRLVRRAHRLRRRLAVEVENPLIWIERQ